MAQEAASLFQTTSSTLNRLGDKTMQTSKKKTVVPRGSIATWNREVGSSRAEAASWKAHFRNPTVKKTVER